MKRGIALLLTLVLILGTLPATAFATGGTLEGGVQRAHGAGTGLSIGGPVRLAQTLTVALADAPC